MNALAQGDTGGQRQDICLNCSSVRHPRRLLVPRGHTSGWTAFRAESLLSQFIACTCAMKSYLCRKGKSQQSAIMCHFFRRMAKGLSMGDVSGIYLFSKEKLENTSDFCLFLWKFLCRLLSSVAFIWHYRAGVLRRRALLRPRRAFSYTGRSLDRGEGSSVYDALWSAGAGKGGSAM